MIDSVLAQDTDVWKLIVSDDGSVQIIKEYADKYRGKICFYQSWEKFGGAKKHFMHLLDQFKEAEYIMLADQDDIWHKDKVSRTLSLMKKLETDKSVPVMVHTDLCVVDQNLKCLSPSFMQFSNFDGNRLKLNTLLIQNVVTGCTMMVNRALACLASKTQNVEDIRMHDWWIALIAAACGKSRFLNEATIDYCQHGSNSVGAKDLHSAKYIIGKSTSRENYMAIRSTYLQAGVLIKEYADVMQEKDKRLVALYADLINAHFIKRRATYLKYGIFKKGLSRKIGQFIFG